MSILKDSKTYSFCIFADLLIKLNIMKKILLSIFALTTLSVTAQNNVSTTPDNRNVVLEEFTGIHCGYCPDGHLLAQQLHDNNPGDVVLINIHVGSYAAPSAGEPDFRTSFGTAIDGQADVAGYPAGTINRHLFPGLQQASGTAMSRGDWASASSQVLPETSPVNLWSEAIVDMGTNTVTVNVEVYYTGSQTITSNKLNIAVLQNNVQGPQSGASANPGSILPNGNYNHNHMLRHLITGQWGDQLDTIAQGTLITRSYTWTIPSDLNGVELDPTNFEVVAFISEGQQEIISGDYSSMSWNFPNTEDAYSTGGLATNLSCNALDATDLTITFKNYGNAPLTSLDIDYSINGGTSTIYPWTGNLASSGTETVSIPNTVITSPLVSNTATFILSNPNGVIDPNPTNNTSAITFSGLGSGAAGNAAIFITTDNYGSETTWNLKNSGGATIADGGPYTDGATTVQTPVAVNLDANECYTLTVLDSYGDGMDAGFGVGSYSIIDQNGMTLTSGGQFTTEDKGYFLTGLATSSNNINKDSELAVYPNPVKNVLTIEGDFTSVNIYDVFGKLVLTSKSQKTIDVSSLSNGVYFANINTKNAITVKKITITK